MKHLPKRFRLLTVAVLCGGLPCVGAPERVPTPDTLTPRIGDYTLSWWADGFPGHISTAPWWRVIRTGSYAFALDTQTLSVPHFGPMQDGLGYLLAARDGNRAWQQLPSAQLALTLTADGKVYRCRAGGKWSEFGGPRLVESGRFVQRADITDLVFTSPEGARLNVEARFETVAWPERLSLILAATALPLAAGRITTGTATISGV